MGASAAPAAPRRPLVRPWGFSPRRVTSGGPGPGQLAELLWYATDCVLCASLLFSFISPGDEKL